jgi:ComF family protein
MDSIDRITSALVYEYPVDRLIMLAKFRARTDAARVLGEFLGRYLLQLRAAGDLHPADVILPVPLHRIRLAKRGFNQAREIALAVSDGLDLPLHGDVCRRIRNTREQTGLTGRARYRNTVGAFRATTNLSGQRIAVIDDVLTTGSTTDAMAFALREAGASHVQVWSVARTVKT